MVGTRIPSGASASCRRDSRTTSCAVGGSGGRGGRRSTKREPSPRSSRKEKFDPPPSPMRCACSSPAPSPCASRNSRTRSRTTSGCRSEEHTSELQSRVDLVCRLLLENKKVRLHLHHALSLV